ncbi:MAG TPA: hypothetical protein VNJ70_03100 [Thermoanaerobaculia bacterium]|nr:hypothetical protein [Thermoanaerobaculia bacterium]
MSEPEAHEVAAGAYARFLAGEATAAERSTIVRHLLADCTACRDRLRAAAPAALPEAAYDEAFSAAQRAVAREVKARRRMLNANLAELDRMPAAEQEIRVRNSRRFASPDLAYALVQRSRDKRFDDPAAMLHCARLAVATAEAAAAGAAGGEALLHDCRARAWGQLANAHRLKSQLPEAAGAFATALGQLALGSGDRELRAWLLSQLSSLRVYERRFAEAFSLLEQVARLYRVLRNRRGEAEALIGLGLARLYAREIEGAIPPLNRALTLLGPHDVEHKRGATLNLAWCYAELQLPGQAHAFLPILERHFAGCTDQVLLLRFDWLRGVVDRDLNLLSAAELRLQWAREGFLAKDLPFESALISLDLAEVYVRQRRLAEVTRTIGEAIPIFEGLGVTRDLLAALMKLHEVAQEQRTAVALLRQIAAQLKARGVQPLS